MGAVVNPFLASLVVALVVAVGVVVAARRRAQTPALAAPHRPGLATGQGIPMTVGILVALALVVVPFAIAVAALWGPTAGVAAYVALVTAVVVALAVTARHSGE